MKYRTECKAEDGTTLAKEYAKRFPDEVEDTLKQLRVNDSNPCSWCGTANNKHSNLYGEEIKKKRECGNRVLICEGPDYPDDDSLLDIKWLMFRCVVTPSIPDDPCDSGFMEEISS